MTLSALFPRTALLAIVLLTRIGMLRGDNATDDDAVSAAFDRYEKLARRMVADAFSSIPPDLLRNLQTAEVSSACSLGIMKVVRGFQNFEPWAFRLFDASGKYPTGVLEGTKSDIGAFDECLETEVVDDFGRVTSRGQYCSLMFYVRNGKTLERKLAPILRSLHPRLRTFKQFFFLDYLNVARVGICLLNDCDQRDLQALINSVKPSIIDIEVAHCITNEPQPWTTTQKAIIIFLITLASVMAASTAVDLFIRRSCSDQFGKGIAAKVLTSFAVTSNTRMLLKMPDEKDSDEYVFRFLHGIRYLSIAFIMFGHCYQTLSDTWSRLLNLLIESNKWQAMFVASAFNSVDTFFFVSGFLMCFITAKNNYSGATTLFFAIVLRHLRTSIPLFFVIMCIYLVPVITSGPDLPTFMERVYEEVSEHWWDLLLQVRNFCKVTHKTMMPHLWYISADFQAFLISLLTFLLLRRRKKLAISAFVLMSVVSCGIATWQIAGTNLPPFMMFPMESPEVIEAMATGHYLQPFYHIVCYFSGCITFLIMDDFKQRKISKPLQAAGWFVSVSCALCCLFIKLPWYRDPEPTTELGKLVTSFFDRILWSMFLSWITLACASGRGGFVRDFLAWKVFVPFSRLSFAVYLIHVPFIEVLLHVSRERIYYSPFNQLSLHFSVSVWSFLLGYVLFLACEAPTGKLSKIAFGSLSFKSRSRNSKLPGAKKDFSVQPRETDGVDVTECNFEHMKNSRLQCSVAAIRS